jgi:drug/metabolite transporter (DMT)-like permease
VKPRRHSVQTNLPPLADPWNVTHSRARRLFNLNTTAIGVAAGSMMALGAPISFAAARAAILNDGFTPADLIVARYVVAGLLMLPVLVYFGASDLAGIGWRRGAILLATGGPPFTVLQTAGLAYAPLGHGGVITPAAVAIISTVLAALILRERPGLVHLAGACLMVLGIVLIGWDGLRGATGAYTWVGDLLFLGAAVPWAIFSVIVRRWRLDALRAITVVAVLSAVVTVPGYLAVADIAHLRTLPVSALVFQGILQGAMHGILAMLGFTHAVRVLGVSRAVFFAAVVPAISVLIGIPALHEIPSAEQWLGLGVVTIGLLAAVLLPPVLRIGIGYHRR